jgi:hypothetical protein
MTRAARTVLRIAAGLVIVGGAVLAMVLWWASSLVQSERVDPARADAVLAEVRARFPGVDPAFRIRERRLVIARPPPDTAVRVTMVTVHIVVWDPRERMLSRVMFPSWTSTIATEPLPLEGLAGIGEQGLGALFDARRRGDELNIRISDLQRYGPTLLLDSATADEKSVLIWNE